MIDMEGGGGGGGGDLESYLVMSVRGLEARVFTRQPQYGRCS